MLVGYARVSTDLQTTDGQIDALHAAGCERVFEESMSGTRTDRPQLAAALEFAREGDVLVVARLDRLARSLRQLLTTVDTLGHGHGRGWLPVLFGCAPAEAPPRTARERRRCGGSAARSRWWCRCSRAATSDQCRVRSLADQSAWCLC